MAFAITFLISSCNKDDELQKSSIEYTVNFTQAKDFAIIHFQNQQKDKLTLRSDWLGESTTIFDNENLPAIHIFNYENGANSSFVIVSGDNRIAPILAQGKSYFPLDTIPFGVADWLQDQINDIKVIRELDPNQETFIRDLWEAKVLPEDDDCCPECPNYPECISSLIDCGADINCNDDGVTDDNPCGNTTYSEYGPLLDTEWGQGCVYNQLCPTEGLIPVPWGLGFVYELECGGTLPCGHFRTGCVGTAMAQVINYFEHPSNYNYASLLPTYNSWSFSWSGADEVAQLMIDAAESINMDFDCDGSGAYTSKVDDALEDDFDYSYGGDYMDYNHSQEVKQNIRWGKPVIFDACREDHVFIINWWYSGCHAWVCDGYKEYKNQCYSSLYYNMNWGWNHTHNGWYKSGSWTPGTRNYQYDKNVLLNINP